jgi:hypothetical protein
MMCASECERLIKNKTSKGDGLFAIAYASLELAEAQRAPAREVSGLGSGDAATLWGRSKDSVSISEKSWTPLPMRSAQLGR